MGLGRLLMLLAVAGVIWLSWRAVHKYRQVAAQKTAPPPAVQMVRCAYCGLHIARQEAVREGEALFCCEAHRRLAQKP